MDGHLLHNGAAFPDIAANESGEGRTKRRMSAFVGNHPGQARLAEVDRRNPEPVVHKALPINHVRELLSEEMCNFGLGGDDAGQAGPPQAETEFGVFQAPGSQAGIKETNAVEDRPPQREETTAQKPQPLKGPQGG